MWPEFSPNVEYSLNVLRLCLSRNKRIREIVQLLLDLQKEDTLDTLVPFIQYKHFYSVCRKCWPIPLKEALLFTEVCDLRDKRMFTQLVSLCKAADRLEEAFKLVSCEQHWARL
jgi:hypothetical protein